jgi:Raf kinase inhibitor-like YbhB/YbcL family protein
MDVSPPLEWRGVPNGAEALLLVCNDPDAPGGVFHHWAAYNIPPELHGLEELPAATLDERFPQAINDFGKPGYRGPCPPRGHKPHAYHFRLSALRNRIDGAPAHSSCVEIIKRAAPIEIGTAELVGFYGR